MRRSLNRKERNLRCSAGQRALTLRARLSQRREDVEEQKPTDAKEGEPGDLLAK